MITEERVAAILLELGAKGSEESRAGMRRYGINVTDAYGVSVHELRRMANPLGRDHELALALWTTGNHEARILASLVDDPHLVTREQMDAWAAGFDSWDVCDQVTSNLFGKTPFAYDVVAEWAAAEEEWVKRAAFATAAALAVHDKRAPDEPFLAILALVVREADDERPYVSKAVNWALRSIGKRNLRLHAAALAAAEKILAAAAVEAARDRRDPAARSARWVARDALRELGGEKVLARLQAAGTSSSRGDRV
jgi:3-methyladenine DNA glycosylase AlkD